MNKTETLSVARRDGGRTYPLADQRPLYEVTKRGLDIVVAVGGLVLLSPLWLLIVLAIRVTSQGPVFFRGKVAGKDGRLFTYYKFRTMWANNDDTEHRRFIESYVRVNKPYAIVSKDGKETPIFKVINDPRVTPVGRWLRRFSLDEVPQLINVLRGEMSIVGPRPPVLHEYQLYDDWAKQRLAVKPGITGLAQVRARGTCPFREMVVMDLEYISRRTLWLDVKLMVLTLPALLLRRGYTG